MDQPSVAPTTVAPVPRFPGVFYHLLINTLIVAVIDFTVWFAITFYTYLETRSVFATAMIAGIYLFLTAASGIWFGSLVDHHRKKSMMMLSTAASFVLYLVGFVIERVAPDGEFRSVGSPLLWAMVLSLMLGVIAGNIRTIAMPTIVTMLFDADRRDRANGLVGSATGVSILVTSVISGLLVAAGGMFYVLILGMAANLAALVHLYFVPLTEPAPTKDGGRHDGVDLRGTFRMVRGTPGLMALIVFSAFNNFLGGVFMALMDAYGLSMMSVQAWGLLWGVLSTGFIIGGLVVARVGLGVNPVRTILLGNVVLWVATILFPIQASTILLGFGMFTYLCLMPVVEAAEQTVLQRVVPFERQGRVFGFAQSVEQSASPLTAFLIGPIAEFIFVPFMTDGAGARSIGSWFGTGPARGLALVFVLTALIGLALTLYALGSKYYRQLSEQYRLAGTVPNGELADLPSANTSPPVAADGLPSRH